MVPFLHGEIAPPHLGKLIAQFSDANHGDPMQSNAVALQQMSLLLTLHVLRHVLYCIVRCR